MAHHTLERKPYVYRLLAYDEAGNVSTSARVNVTPHDSGRRGTISSFSVQTVYAPTIELPHRAPFDLMQAINDTIEVTQTVPQDSLLKLATYQLLSADEYDELREERNCWLVHDFITQRQLDFCRDYLDVDVYLSWYYDQPGGVQDFQLYRSVDGGALQLYRSLRPEDLRYEDHAYGADAGAGGGIGTRIIGGIGGGSRGSYYWRDGDVQAGRRYAYRLVARHADGGYSAKSEVKIVRTE